MTAALDAFAFGAGLVLAGFLFGLGFLGAVEVWTVLFYRNQP